MDTLVELLAALEAPLIVIIMVWQNEVIRKRCNKKQDEYDARMASITDRLIDAELRAQESESRSDRPTLPPRQ